MISQHTKKTLEAWRKKFVKEADWRGNGWTVPYVEEHSAVEIEQWLSTKLEDAQRVGREQILEEMMGKFEHPEFCRARGEQFKECARCIFANLSKTEGIDNCRCAQELTDCLNCANYDHDEHCDLSKTEGDKND